MINYLYASKSHFVIFQVQLRAQTPSYDSETSNKPSKKSKAPTSHFSSNGKLLGAKIFEKNRLALIIIINYLYASKLLHFVIFQVQLRAQDSLGSYL